VHYYCVSSFLACSTEITLSKQTIIANSQEADLQLEGGLATPGKFFAPLGKMCWTYCSLKNLGSSQKTLRPRWFPKLVTACQEVKTNDEDFQYLFSSTFLLRLRSFTPHVFDFIKWFSVWRFLRQILRFILYKQNYTVLFKHLAIIPLFLVPPKATPSIF